MLVTLQYGPNAGSTRHVERNQITQLLLDLRLIELADLTPIAPPAPTKPHFYVAASIHSGALGLHVQMPGGEMRATFTEASTRKQTEAALGAGPIPDDVWDNFVTRRDVENQRNATGGRFSR